MKHIQTILLISLLTLIVGTTTSMAQGMRMTPEERVKQLKDSLSLNDKQTEQITAIYKELGAQRQALQDSIQDRSAMREAMRGLMAKSDEKVKAVLTTEQKEKFEAMIKAREARFRQRMN